MRRKELEKILAFFTTLFLVVGGCGSKKSSVTSSSSLTSRSSKDVSPQQQVSCVPLPSCEPLMQLVKNKDNIPGMTRSAVMKTLRDAMCGFEGNTPKVLCNRNEEEEELDAADDNVNSANQTVAQFQQAVVRSSGGGLIDHKTGGNDCEGVLRLHHLSPESGEVGTLLLKKRQYSALRSLGDRTVYNSQVDGGCCWKISAQPGFAGRHENLGLGKTGSPEVQPRAAKKIACSEVTF